jgi:hypothetical protein
MITVKKAKIDKKRFSIATIVALMLLGLSSLSFADSDYPYPYYPNQPLPTVEQSLSAGVAAAVNSALELPPYPYTSNMGTGAGHGWHCPPGQAKKGNCFCPPGQHMHGNC